MIYYFPANIDIAIFPVNVEVAIQSRNLTKIVATSLEDLMTAEGPPDKNETKQG